MPTYNKLVRDKIPTIIKESGRKCTFEILNDEDYESKLREKLKEEIEEYLAATIQGESLEELADVLEIIHALTETHGSSVQEIERIRVEKAEERGGFNNRILLIDVE